MLFQSKFIFLTSIVAAGLVAPATSEAMPLAKSPMTAPIVTIAGGCGPYAHRNPWGACVPGGGWGGAPVYGWGGGYYGGYRPGFYGGGYRRGYWGGGGGWRGGGWRGGGWHGGGGGGWHGGGWRGGRGRW